MSLVETILKETRDIADTDFRSLSSIMMSIVSELGELAEEIDIAYGGSYKESEEGIPAEAIDLVIGIIYLLRMSNPEIDEEAMKNIAQKKIQKWKDILNGN